MEITNPVLFLILQRNNLILQKKYDLLLRIPKNREEMKKYAAYGLELYSPDIMGCCKEFALPPCKRISPKGTKRRKITNDKLNITPKDLWGILIAAAATALCVAIDVILKGNEQ